MNRKQKAYSAYMALAVVLVAAMLYRHGPNHKKIPTATSQGQAPAVTLSPGAKVLYLTFDGDMTQGMLAKLQSGKISIWYDPRIPQYLQKEQVPATLFSTGLFAATYPVLIAQLHASGWGIGNHTYDHAAFSVPCYGLPAVGRQSAKEAEIVMTQEIIKKIIGVEPKYFRFPGLCHKPDDDALVKKYHLQISDGDVISGDAFNANAGGIAKKVLQEIKPGSVILFHLGGPNAPATLAVLQNIIPKLKHQQYAFMALP